MDEIVDIVDENDQVIGQELKSICHKKGISHRGANIFVFKDDSYNELLLNKRSMQKETRPGILCTPGGHVGTGESYFEAAKREFFEEMFNNKNIDNSIIFEKLFKVKKTTDEDYEFMTVYRTISQGPFTPDPTEVESYYFEDIQIIFKDISKEPKKYTDTTIFLLEEYKKRFL